ncbi:MAG: hypothetical protein ACREV7_05640 [Steroidobacteraceae bacterium]
MPSPRSFFHRIMGAPSELLDSEQAYAYARSRPPPRACGSRKLDVPPDRVIYLGDGSSDVHVMLHVNSGEGFTIAVSENRQLARIARCTVLSDNACSAFMPILDQVLGRRMPEIRHFLESHGLALDGWEKARTDRARIRETASTVAAAD